MIYISNINIIYMSIDPHVVGLTSICNRLPAEPLITYKANDFSK